MKITRSCCRQHGGGRFEKRAGRLSVGSRSSSLGGNKWNLETFRHLDKQRYIERWSGEAFCGKMRLTGSCAKQDYSWHSSERAGESPLRRLLSRNSWENCPTPVMEWWRLPRRLSKTQSALQHISQSWRGTQPAHSLMTVSAVCWWVQLLLIRAKI